MVRFRGTAYRRAPAHSAGQESDNKLEGLKSTHSPNDFLVFFKQACDITKSERDNTIREKQNCSSRESELKKCSHLSNQWKG
jgi:hypothetical protein